ncbi:hypothetical protein BFR57_07140 [Idiomarina sp. MD25a]|uniref:hypothetical protein n=1 Tax=Idiomarina sp. MD25a TaxID=1889913 RepID=UPI0008F8E734|nr:hypothetical protein [Idiomarina sp. MD25a]OIN01823.1 hypothetical protein BFR57_07140 [Idiomarina sp. MD25a]
MADGYHALKNQLGSLKEQLKYSSILTKGFFIISLFFLLASIFEPSLLAISGSFIVASVAVFNSDIQRYSHYIDSEIQKAQALNEFQNFLITLIHRVDGVRVNYKLLLQDEDQAYKKFNRAIHVPFIAHIPEFNSDMIFSLFSKLSFTSKLISKEDAENINSIPLETKAKSITFLSFHITCLDGWTELWKLHNSLHEKTPKKPMEGAPDKVVFEHKSMNDIQLFQNYMLATDNCLILTDELLTISQAALDYFIPEATNLIDSEALKVCPVPPLSDKVFVSDNIFQPLDDEQQAMLDSLPQKLAEKLKNNETDN